ncbi:hypothetical protein EFK50_07415 [Nocardioides marmoriginsengisoli]|uniref:ScoMcrA-like N-terminal head domain-containing protein n=1 Tax=Nocardioides marmoriginsengisoli TaxID=661483 RepID=A0A3N0CLL7_9ACTN|nr:hypothetical protein [Nocardioides marmoriginsengisoli]RNL64348.1 hypothetical protein EFK50_07415 [Nocardioides marmoriginsengisoli]
MPSLARVSRINVLTAIRDHGLQGAGPFLEALGFEGPSDEVLVERGRRYDARALLAYAHGKATGEPLTPDQVSLGSLKVLSDLGFEVAFRADLDRAKQAPAARTRVPGTPKPRASRAAAPAKPEPVVALCPSCFTQLSKMGTCDFCE